MKKEIPNKETQKAMEDVRLRRDLTTAKNTKELFRQLNVRIEK